MNAHSLPIIFLALLGISMLAYVILDGYDLGVGILMRRADAEQKDAMLASIGPFWDANETWLVLGVGLLLVAFPMAHGVILTALYLPVAIMLFGLTLRGVAFDFRSKAQAHHKRAWNRAFYAGSLITSLAQGVMLGLYIVGFRNDAESWLFAAFVGLGLTAGYALLGAGWLIIKTTGALQMRAIAWARGSLWLTAAGIAAISIATPLVSSRIFAKWFTLPNFLALLPIPLLTAGLILLTEHSLRRLAANHAAGNTDEASDRYCWVPFACTVGVFVLAFAGLAYSLFPYLVVDRITIWDSASAPESLKIILVGAIVVLPMIVGYTIFAHRVFWGKSSALRYY